MQVYRGIWAVTQVAVQEYMPASTTDAGALQQAQVRCSAHTAAALPSTCPHENGEVGC
jgi:hypothetical protein